MNRDDYLFVLSERNEVLSMLRNISDEDIISRMSLESRLEGLNKTIKNNIPQVHPQAKATITFKGDSVLGTHGIAANFSSKIVGAFNDAVSLIASSFQNKVSSRNDNMLMITGTAKGSFGFTLEEFHSDPPLDFDEETFMSKAMAKTLSILQMSVNADDDGLADAIADLDTKTLDKIRRFMKILFENRTVFTLKHGNESLIFSDINQINLAIEKLSKENIKEELKVISVKFSGVLPHKRQCEFVIIDDEIVSVAKISSNIKHPDVINNHLGQEVKASFLCTQVGNGKIKYSLREIPDW
ncbi:hypothetical protein [Photorhabdus luminescens]|uniref:Uncharacterized protein n=1 Tax=Photorhabdus luminescens subsp. sonorensis TaxID=1173677 RepID=A0A5C4RID4_PHOLU|nr:hypothetical protein [Photorhabdus luminescens]TNH43783.1 hypothetical protein EP164_09560 [Photorhabdus luminescens subsp. sonorensis]